MTLDPRIAEMIPGPIEDWIAQLVDQQSLPVLALGACVLRPAESAPPLRRLVVEATNNGIPDDAGLGVQLFRALHLLGAMRDQQAFPVLLGFLQLPAEVIDDFLGEMTTETLPRVIIGTFDGDAEALFGVVLRPEVEASIRGALLQAAAFLTWQGRVDRDRMTTFLAEIVRQPRADNDYMLWFGWEIAISLLGLRTLAPLVYDAVKNGLLDEDLFEPAEFEESLARAERNPEDGARFEEAHLGYIEDIQLALERFSLPSDQEEFSWDDDPRYTLEPGIPVVNPLRHVGRNDPCPCGSGKKAKRCCLAA